MYVFAGAGMTEEEKYANLMPKLLKAAAENDWDNVESLICLNEVIMEDGLKRVYPLLPPEYKYKIPTRCYTNHGDGIPMVRKYVRQARKFVPVERRVPADLRALPEITVYRAGEEPITQAANSISWTTSIDVAKWFYHRALTTPAPNRKLYQGTIQPDRIIRYTDGRNEKEVMQYRAVKNIQEIDPDEV